MCSSDLLLMDGDYFDGLEEGEWKNYWENGELKNQSSFKGGLLDGKWFSYYPDGKPKLEGEYQDNMRVGEWTEYFDNGRPKDVMTYKLFKKKTAMDYGIMKGHKRMESKLHGKAVSYSSKDFRMTEEGNYVEGEKDGEWIAYHPGGKNPAVVSQYKKGKLHGKMTTYSRRGKLLQECDYKDGLKDGKFIIYDNRGRVVAEKEFKDGMQIIEGTTNGSGSFTPGR